MHRSIFFSTSVFPRLKGSYITVILADFSCHKIVQICTKFNQFIVMRNGFNPFSFRTALMTITLLLTDTIITPLLAVKSAST